MELLLETQIQHAQHLPVFFGEQAVKPGIMHLFLINAAEGLRGEFRPFHIADKIINDLPVPGFSLPERDAHLPSGASP